MTRQRLRIFVLPIIAFSAACGPPPVGPRAVLDPPPDPAPVEAGADANATPLPGAPDGGVGELRQKLPAPDAGARDAADTATTDAGVEVPAGDAGVETVAARAPIAGEILIVEVLVNPAGQDAGREWIEIVNRTAEAIDLGALHLADASADVAAAAGVIEPGGRIVLAQSADASKNGGAPAAVAYGTRLALNNDGEELSICVGACAAGMVIDRVAWKTLGAGYDGHALVLDRDANLTCAATEPFGTAGDFGTPGEPDRGCAAPDAGF